MHTTIAVSPTNRDRLFALKRAWRLRNMDQVLDRILQGTASAEDARALYARNRSAVDEVLRRHGIDRLVAFGSRARGDARADSDLDLAISVPDDTSAFELVHIQDDLAGAFGVQVDVVTLRSLKARLLAKIEREGVTLYG